MSFHSVVVAYFLIVCLALVVALRTDTSRRTALTSDGRKSVVARHVKEMANRQRRIAGAAEVVLRDAAADWRFLPRLAKRRVTAFAAFALGPPLAVLALPRHGDYDGGTALAVSDSHIAALLAGERLTPPAAPPPAVFVSAAAEVVPPHLPSASRDWALLDDGFAQRLLSVFRLMKERHGYELVLLEGYRSPERQAELARLGPAVTQAGPNMSYHQHGLAADIAFLKEGRLVLSERDPWVMRGYELYGELAEAAGLSWGGRWNLMDFGHVELRRPGVLGRARSG